MDSRIVMQRHERSMAANGLSVPPSNWPTLLDRMLVDVGRIAQLNLQLLEAKLAQSLMAMADRAIAGMAILYLGMVGGSCLVVALILLLHVWIALWLCFAICGVVIIACGLAINLRMQNLAKTAETGVVELRRAGDPSSVG